MANCWVFQICWYIECSSLTVSYFRIWNSAAGIISPPLALFVVMLPKVHLTSHSRVSGSRGMTTSLWLSWLLRLFLYSSSVHSCYLFFISSASVRSYHFCPLWCPSLHENVPFIFPIFLKRSVVFPILLFSSISLHCSFKKAFFYLLAILWNSAFSLLYLSFSPWPSCISFRWDGISHSTSVQCYEPLSIVLHTLSLSDLISWICHLHCINYKGYDRSYLNGLMVSPTFFNLSQNFAIRSSWSEPQSCFCWLYRASPSLAAKNIINLISILTIWQCPCVESSLKLL